MLSIILLLVLYLSFGDYFFPKKKIDFSKFEKEISDFETEQKRMDDSLSHETKNYFTSSNTPNADSAERFSFNPNNLPEEDWKRLGLSDKQIKVIKKYESKGGKFRTKEDVKKMYCITPELYTLLEPYLLIPKDRAFNTFDKPEILHLKPETLLIELNSADTTALDKLKGIGFTFAKRIIKYREMLGGYVKKEQLLEVYGFDKEKYDGLSENIFVDVLQAKKFNINTVTFDELKRHPYIKYNLANLMVNYRKQHGNYKSVDDVKKLNLVNEEIFTKIAPYLKVE